MANAEPEPREVLEGLRGTASKHIVDALLEERAPRMMQSPIWPLIRAPLFALMGYGAACRTADAIANLDGSAALKYARDLLHLDVKTYKLERIPDSGRCFIVANHPTGIADGIALSQALEEHRPDHCFFANADALRICPGLGDRIIPVEWMKEKRTLEKTKLIVRRTQAAFAKGNAIVVFPSGAPARLIGGAIREPPWERSIVAFARKFDAPVIPVHVSGPIPVSYHVFHLISRELRNLTLFREFLSKAGRSYKLIAGPAIPPAALAGPDRETIERLRRFVAVTLAREPDQIFS